MHLDVCVIKKESRPTSYYHKSIGENLSISDIMQCII